MAVQYKKVLDLATQLSELRKKEAGGFEYVVLNQIEELLYESFKILRK